MRNSADLCNDARKGTLAFGHRNSADLPSSTAKVVVWKLAAEGFYGATPAWISSLDVPAPLVTRSEVY